MRGGGLGLERLKRLVNVMLYEGTNIENTFDVDFPIVERTKGDPAEITIAETLWKAPGNLYFPALPFRPVLRGQ